jgi:cell division protein FtsN
MEVLHTPSGGPPLGERYFVQIGSFADVRYARRMRERLIGSYSDVHVVEAVAGENRYYRVRMGAFMNRRAAQNRAARVSGLGVPVVIITE